MLETVLLAGKVVFLIVLYLFIYRVVRSATRELRAAAPVADKRQWSAGAEMPAAGRPVAAGTGGGRPGGVWTLVVEKSPCLPPGTAFAFPVGTSALAGRSPEADIHLDDTFVSSKHALFETTADGLRLEDLRSTNGTQVNGVDIAGAVVLQAGDQVEVGDTVFRVEVR
ncbi:MAG: FHA domain-containing protein [Actinomycetia bacterium]|nr:FHA domain-containing protein [Actinomycetes bacterium]